MHFAMQPSPLNRIVSKNLDLGIRIPLELNLDHLMPPPLLAHISKIHKFR